MTEDRLGAAVPQRDRALDVGHDHRVGRLFDDIPVERFFVHHYRLDHQSFTISRCDMFSREGRTMIETRLTQMFGLQHPVVLGPMGGVAGGELAAAVSNAGGLGIVGGGYGNPQWLRTELDKVARATTRPWGVGLITWSIRSEALEVALSHSPAVFVLSFGDPRPHAPAIKRA